MVGKRMIEAPRAEEGAAYPVVPITDDLRRDFQDTGLNVPAEATHCTFDFEGEHGGVVDWLREVAFKTYRGPRPVDDDDLYPPLPTFAEHRELHPSLGWFVGAGYELVEQVAP